MIHKRPDDKARVVVSKHWTQPEITVAIRHNELGAWINLEIGVQDFARAIVREMGRKRWSFWDDTAEDHAAAAAATVIEKIKANHGHEVLTL